MSKVVIGMSGGVDSSVAAHLLLQEGYEVIGVTFRFTEDLDPKDAIETCKKLNIEHHILDYRNIFKELVINKFIDDYKKGITPNPCILCNRLIKFNFLYDAMLKYNADYFATGHYAKTENGKLYKSIDLNKDQTYFLCNITKEQLNCVLFPLDGFDKNTVREIAQREGLINANKKDSTDVCFINSKFKDYIQTKLTNIKGPVINITNNKIIGEHTGLFKYTIGQRRGINIGGTTDRMYVVGKDIEKNILYIATGEDNTYLISTSCILENVNIFNNEKITKCKAKFRYHQEEIDVKINWITDTSVEVIYNQGIKSVTPGQACAFYKNNECLGGGIITTIKKNNKEIWYL